MTEQGRPTHRVAIVGSSGMLGSALTDALLERGDHVVRLVRQDPDPAPPAGLSEVRWDTERGLFEPGALDEVTAVVNLAGANLGGRRWTTRYKNTLVESRVTNTNTLSQTLAQLPHRPRFLSGSAIGAYGSRGDVVLTETSPLGTGFVPDLVRDWEHATWAAQEAGISVAHLRSGIVLSRSGGGLGRLLPLVKFGLAGKMGSGQQYWSWISLPDHVAAMLFLIDRPDITGAVNLTAPEPAPQVEVVKALAEQLNRPSFVPAPTIALRLALGEMATEILGSQRVLPAVLTSHGFTYQHPDLTSAAAWVTQRETD
jgi:hypothetical protein